MKSKLHLLALAVATTILTACGGGGGDTQPTTTPPTATASFNTNLNGFMVQPLNTTPQASSHAAGSMEKVAFDTINEARGKCGFGYLKQDARLDQMAKNHAAWSILNNLTGHVEAAGQPGFTGVSTRDRASFVGVDSKLSVSEGIGYTFVASTEVGLSLPRGLLSAPYHAMGLLSGSTHLGVGLSTSSSANIAQLKGALVENRYIDAGGTQHPAKGSLRVYPCAGSVVAPSLSGENPSPVPTRNLATNPVGPAIYVISDLGTTVKILGITVTHVATSTTLATLSPTDSSNDPNKFLQSNTAFVFVDQPAVPESTYTYVVRGTVDGVPFTKSEQFTTDKSRPGVY